MDMDLTIKPTEAGSTGAAAELPEIRIPGEAGVWVLIFGEMTFFAALFASFLYYRGLDAKVFAASQPELSKPIGVFNTLLLLTGSLFVAMGVKAVSRAATRTAPRLFAASLICGLAFIAMKGIEYHELISRGIGINTNVYFNFYFGLTALHLGHVVIGSMLLCALALITRKPVRRTPHFALVESAGCFWHMVDLLWIIIFALVYLVV